MAEYGTTETVTVRRKQAESRNGFEFFALLDLYESSLRRGIANLVHRKQNLHA